MKKPAFFILLISVIFWISACEKQETELTYYFYEGDDWEQLTRYLDLPVTPYIYERTPKFGETEIKLDAVHASMSTLGRTLFYDKDISADGKIACASCHLQSHAFSDTLALSNGVNNRQTKRNSLALAAVRDFSSAYGGGSGNFFWDDRALNLQNQCTETFNNPDEMGVTLSQVVKTISDKNYYRILAKYANLKSKDGDKIDSSLVLNSLATFMNSMASTQSRFDEGMTLHKNDHKAAFSNFTHIENQGKTLFNANCSSCHGTNFTRSKIARANNGLLPKQSDLGRWNVSGDENDKNVFKVPILRNLVLTAPYMHDGRFQTLENVLDHYSNNIVYQENLHPDLKVNDAGTLKARQFNFSEEDKQALIAFLHTLTDPHIIDDVRFSDPFRR